MEQGASLRAIVVAIAIQPSLTYVELPPELDGFPEPQPVRAVPSGQ